MCLKKTLVTSIFANNDCNNSLYIGSSASQYINHQRHCFLSYRKVSNKHKVYLGDETCHDLIGMCMTTNLSSVWLLVCQGFICTSFLCGVWRALAFWSFCKVTLACSDTTANKPLLQAPCFILHSICSLMSNGFLLFWINCALANCVILCDLLVLTSSFFFSSLRNGDTDVFSYWVCSSRF